MPAIHQGQRAAGKRAHKRLEQIEPKPPRLEPRDLLAPMRAALHDDRERLDESGFQARRPPRQFRKPRGSESDAGGLLIEAMAKPLAVARFPGFLRPRFPSRRALLPVAAVASPLSSYRRPLCLPSLCAGLGDFLWRGLSISTAWPQLTK
jgi:hypothetical protein